VQLGNPSDDDLKQMFAYNIYWNTGKSILLYPGSKILEEKFGNFHKGRQDGNQCKVGFISVLNENGKLDRQIADRIMGKLI
jgi:5-methylcytosine-specific restriction enzyme subunit McrC